MPARFAIARPATPPPFPAAPVPLAPAPAPAPARARARTSSATPMHLAPVISPRLPPPPRVKRSRHSATTSRPGHRCLVPTCLTTRTSKWCMGPDGSQTLCFRCYVRYTSLKLPIYRRPNGTLSVVWTPSSRLLRVTGFAARPSSTSGRRDISRPFTEPAPAPAPPRRPPPVTRPPQRACLRTECRRVCYKLFTGPDGVKTLCGVCYRHYFSKRLLLFEDPAAGTVSVIATPGWRVVKVVGWPVRGGGEAGKMRELANPMVVPANAADITEWQMRFATGRGIGARLARTPPIAPAPPVTGASHHTVQGQRRAPASVPGSSVVAAVAAPMQIELPVTRAIARPRTPTPPPSVVTAITAPMQIQLPVTRAIARPRTPTPPPQPQAIATPTPLRDSHGSFTPPPPPVSHASASHPARRTYAIAFPPTPPELRIPTTTPQRPRPSQDNPITFPPSRPTLHIPLPARSPRTTRTEVKAIANPTSMPRWQQTPTRAPAPPPRPRTVPQAKATGAPMPPSPPVLQIPTPPRPQTSMNAQAIAVPTSAPPVLQIPTSTPLRRLRPPQIKAIAFPVTPTPPALHIPPPPPRAAKPPTPPALQIPLRAPLAPPLRRTLPLQTKAVVSPPLPSPSPPVQPTAAPPSYPPPSLSWVPPSSLAALSPRPQPTAPRLSPRPQRIAPRLLPRPQPTAPPPSQVAPSSPVALSPPSSLASSQPPTPMIAFQPAAAERVLECEDAEKRLEPGAAEGSPEADVVDTQIKIDAKETPLVPTTVKEPPFPALRRESETSSQAPSSREPDPLSSDDDEDEIPDEEEGGILDEEEGEILDESKVVVETLDPRRVREKVCLWPGCGETSPPEWRSGPDGLHTLCKNCSRRYSEGQFILWQDPESEEVSVVKRGAWRRVRVTGFLHRGRISKDLLRPVVEPVAEVEVAVARKEEVHQKDGTIKSGKMDAQAGPWKKAEQDLAWSRRNSRFSSRRLRSDGSAEPPRTRRGRKRKRMVTEREERVEMTTPHRRSKRLALIGSAEQSTPSADMVDVDENGSVDDTHTDVRMQAEAATVPSPSAETSRRSGPVVPGMSRRQHRMSSTFQTVVKAEYNGKNIAVTIPVRGTYNGFVGELRRVFAMKRGFSIKYADEEGDLVTLGNKRDYKEMLLLIGKGDVARIRVRLFDATKIRKVQTQ